MYNTYMACMTSATCLCASFKKITYMSVRSSNANYEEFCWHLESFNLAPCFVVLCVVLCMWYVRVPFVSCHEANGTWQWIINQLILSWKHIWNWNGQIKAKQWKNCDNNNIPKFICRLEWKIKVYLKKYIGTSYLYVSSTESVLAR